MIIPQENEKTNDETREFGVVKITKGRVQYLGRDRINIEYDIELLIDL
jgi:hypothetical protein